MKITAIKGYPVKVGHRNQFVVKVETDEGICGVGEGGISGRELAMQGMLDHLGRFLIGEDPRQIEHHWQTMYRGAYFEGGKILGAVISAIDIALWDILGQSLGVPVYQLLGGACRDRCPCFASPGSLNGPQSIERAKELVAQGWRSLRFGPGMPTTPSGKTDDSIYEPLESLELAAHWIKEARKELGPNVELSIDFHHRLSVAEAAHFCQKIADVNLFFIEEPIRAENPKAYQQLRTMTPIPFAIGEEFSSKWAFAPFIEEGILNFARVDISNVGGLTEAKKVAGWCETHYIDMMPHNPLGPITTAASIHFGIATPNFAALEYQHRLAESYPTDLFPTMPAIEADSFPIPTAPGLGVTFNEEAAKEHAFEYWEAPHLRRRDGSYTNW
ncbi:MAG TPA: mandelate racemase/muconate lactonizing enzyme family protein [Thermomicrobiales bacterium]|nr:mandelate racemase/muconate lactonizing enzyme family protein [Thermomicrobiales bacterium]